MHRSPTNPVPARNKARLLCVDDNPRFLELFAAVLEAAGYSVVATLDPRNALELALSAGFDLAIVDYDMPYMNGKELACKIKQHKCQMPIILLSGNPSLPADVVSFVDGYVAKGEGVEILLQTLSAMVQRPMHADVQSSVRASFKP